MLENIPAVEAVPPVIVPKPARLTAIYQFLPWVAAAYVIGAVVLLLRLQLRIWRGSRLCSRSPAVQDPSLLDLAARLAMQAGLKCVPAIRYCDHVVVPTVVGILKPVVLVPASLISQLTPEELTSILNHELAHIRRWDPIVQVLQKTVEALLFFHPVTWWLSRRIRIERENCCDDIASQDSGQLSYAAALLRMAELCVGDDQNRSAALANLAVDGNNKTEFASRIRRLIGAEDTPSFSLSRRGVYLLIAVGLLASVSFAASASNQPESDEPSEVNTVDEDQPAMWGDESNGLRCRILPVSPSMDAEKIVMTTPVDRFASPGEITFAVEIENVSDKPIKLKDVRRSDGTSAANHYAPHLVEFLFTDPSGKPIARTQREFVLSSHAHILHNALVTEIEPRQKLKCLLQPAKFQRSMEYRLPPGDYRVQVRYQGPSQAVKDWVVKVLKQQKPEPSWSHQLTSNVVSFSIAADGFRQPDLVWGPKTDGLQAALEIRVPRDSGIPTQAPGILPKTIRGAVLHVKNVSDKPITFVSETGRQGDTLQIKTAEGKAVKVKGAWFSGWPIDVKWTIQPGEVAELDVLTPGLNQPLAPGEYSARYTIRFNSRTLKDKDGNQTFPAPGDYQSNIDTGWTPLFLRDPSQVSQTIDAQPESDLEASAIDGGKEGDAFSAVVRFVGGDQAEPIPGLQVTATNYGEDAKKYGPFTTDEEGKTKVSLPTTGSYRLTLGATKETPWLPVEKKWIGKRLGGMNSLYLMVTKDDLEKGPGEEKGPLATSKNGERLVSFHLIRACKVVLRAVDADTGEGIPGAEFYTENALGEMWADEIFGKNIGYRKPILTKDRRTNSEGTFIRWLGSDAGYAYGVQRVPPGYELINPKEVEFNIRYGQAKAEHVFKFKRVENILWSKKSRNGLRAGAKLLSATGRLEPGDPVVVQFVLKNDSDKEQTFVLRASDSLPTLGANNRLELNVVGSSQNTFQHTLKPGEILEKRQYRVTVDTTGMPLGKYHITSGSAFWQTQVDKPNSATGIPFRREVPFTLGDPKLVKQKQPPVDENPETKIYWGKPSGNLILGMRLPKGRQTWPDDQTTFKGNCFCLTQVTTKSNSPTSCQPILLIGTCTSPVATAIKLSGWIPLGTPESNRSERERLQYRSGGKSRSPVHPCRSHDRREDGRGDDQRYQTNRC